MIAVAGGIILALMVLGFAALTKRLLLPIVAIILLGIAYVWWHDCRMHPERDYCSWRSEPHSSAQLKTGPELGHNALELAITW